MQNQSDPENLQFLQGGGEMGRLTRAKDWSKTAVGDPKNWPQSLRTALSIVLNSRFPMFLFWGPELICFYNDAYRPSLGNEGKHPSILGGRGEDYWQEIWHIIKPLIDQVLVGGEATWSEDQLIPIFRNGKIEDVYWTFSYSPVNDESGKPAGVFVTCSETTSKVNTLRQLEESERRFRNMAESSTILIALSDDTGNATYFNKAWTDLTGKSVADLIQYGWAEIIHPEDRNRYVQNYLDAFKARIGFSDEFRVLNKNGEYCWLTAKLMPRFQHDLTFSGYISSCFDITELKQAEAALRESENRLNIVIQASELGTWEFYPESKAVNYSRRYLEVFGHNEDIKLTHAQLLQQLHPEDLPIREKAFKDAFETGYLHYESRLIWKDHSIHWMEGRGKVFFDAQHKPEKLIGTIRDITKEKLHQKELEESENKLRLLSNSLEKQVQERTLELEHKNAELKIMNKELQSFAYISSHDLQEPLRKIQTFSSQIIEKESHHLSESGKDKFQRLQNAAQRMQTLIDDLLTYSRTSSSETKFEPVDLNQIMDEVIDDLKEDLKEKQATIEVIGLPIVNVIPYQFRQLLHNLIGNSLKFSKEGISPQISIKSEIISGSKIHHYKLDPEKEYCHISISDNGIGFESEYSEKIFELFQRLHSKNQYIGTGIGLAIVKRIVENHQGIITAKGIPNQGATFELFIPISQSQEEVN